MKVRLFRKRLLFGSRAITLPRRPGRLHLLWPCCPPAQAPGSRRIRSCYAFKTHKKTLHLGVQISRYLALKMDGEYLPVFSCIFEILIKMSKKKKRLGVGAIADHQAAAVVSEVSTHPNSAPGPKMLQGTHQGRPRPRQGLSPSRQAAGALARDGGRPRRRAGTEDRGHHGWAVLSHLTSSV